MSSLMIQVLPLKMGNAQLQGLVKEHLQIMMTSTKLEFSLRIICTTSNSLVLRQFGSTYYQSTIGKHTPGIFGKLIFCVIILSLFHK